MGIVDTRCRKCGKQTTEYEKNKWKCLACGLKFIYEPPQPNLPPKFTEYSVNIKYETPQPNLPPKFTVDSGNTKWYQRTPTVLVSVLLIGPFALPLIWFNPKYSMTSKVIWTIAVIGLTLLLCVGSVGLYANLLKQIQESGL